MIGIEIVWKVIEYDIAFKGFAFFNSIAINILYGNAIPGADNTFTINIYISHICMVNIVIPKTVEVTDGKATRRILTKASAVHHNHPWIAFCTDHVFTGFASYNCCVYKLS